MSDKRTILQYKNRKIRTPLSKDVLIFLFCVLLSTISWLIYTLSQDKVTHINLPLIYTNHPVNYIITDSLPEFVKLKVKDSGFSIFSYHFMLTNKGITIDLKNGVTKKGNKLILSMRDLEKKVLTVLNPSMHLLQIEPKLLVFTYEKLYEKALPVVLHGTIKLSQQYILKDEISLTPAIITVYGAKAMLDTMLTVQTKKIVMDNIDKSTALVTTPRTIQGIRYETDTIKISIPVELYTEKIMNIPIEPENFPSNIELRTFPASVHVSFVVGLSRFNDIKPEHIKASIDYKDLLNNKDGKQVVKLSTKLGFIKNLKHTPNSVEYILEEN